MRKFLFELLFGIDYVGFCELLRRYKESVDESKKILAGWAELNDMYEELLGITKEYAKMLEVERTQSGEGR